MLDRAVHMVHQVRAARAAFFPIGAKHEVICGQLAATAEQIGQGQFALRPDEGVLLLDFGPGELAALRLSSSLRCVSSFS